MVFSVKLAMIARNEERCIGRALASVMPHVDAAYVADTGSTDETVSIARSHGAVVVSAPWRDDFSHARNLALDAADADWTLVLDADEWLTEGAATLERLRALPPERAGVVQVCSTFELDGRLEQEFSSIVRISPRGVRYQGRIHEQPTPVGERFAIPLLLAHDGYEPSQLLSKRGRNELLLRAALRDSNGDPYLHYQLGKDLELQDRFAEAVNHYSRALSANPDEAWRHDLDSRAIYVLKKSHLFDEGIALAEAAMERWPQSPDIPFALGDLLLDAALSAPERASSLLPLVEAAWLRSLEIGDNSRLVGSVAGRGSHLAARNLAAFHQALGNETEAGRYQKLSSALVSTRVDSGRLAP
ncbi:MAG: glycosyltransferase [Dermatophilus congolensis]|nr:glycosyltransferase [Dermatophilus congolensis]